MYQDACRTCGKYLLTSPHFNQAIHLSFLNLGSLNSPELLYVLFGGFSTAFGGSWAVGLVPGECSTPYFPFCSYWHSHLLWGALTSRLDTPIYSLYIIIAFCSTNKPGEVPGKSNFTPTIPYLCWLYLPHQYRQDGSPSVGSTHIYWLQMLWGFEIALRSYGGPFSSSTWTDFITDTSILALEPYKCPWMLIYVMGRCLDTWMTIGRVKTSWWVGLPHLISPHDSDLLMCPTVVIPLV